MGVSDDYALGILAESVGLAIPTVVLSFVKTAHPAFGHSVAVLRAAHVCGPAGPGELEPHPPGTGADRLDAFPWHRTLERAEALPAEEEGRASGPGSPPHTADG
jgi:hypothetical protein